MWQKFFHLIKAIKLSISWRTLGIVLIIAYMIYFNFTLHTIGKEYWILIAFCAIFCVIPLIIRLISFVHMNYNIVRFSDGLRGHICFSKEPEESQCSK